MPNLCISEERCLVAWNDAAGETDTRSSRICRSRNEQLRGLETCWHTSLGSGISGVSLVQPRVAEATSSGCPHGGGSAASTRAAAWSDHPCSRTPLSFKGEIKLPKDYCSSDLDLDTDFEVVLPRRRGLGLCSTALVSYLIALHNEVISTVEKFSGENSR